MQLLVDRRVATADNASASASAHVHGREGKEVTNACKILFHVDFRVSTSLDIFSQYGSKCGIPELSCFNAAWYMLE